MIGVLLWLSAGAFLALVVSFRVGLETSTGLFRLTERLALPRALPTQRTARSLRACWVAVLLLAVLSDVFEPLEGYNDPDDPLAVLPRLVKWGWFAGLVASVGHRARALAVPILAGAHIAAVGYILDAGELLLYTSGADRAAWLADKVTLATNMAHGTWVQAGLAPERFPAHVLGELLMGLAPWFTPGCLLLLLGWCYLLFRSALANSPLSTPAPPLPVVPLGPVALLLSVGAWGASVLLPGSGFLVALGDLGRVAWLLHLLGTWRLLGQVPRLRWSRPLLLTLGFVLPQTVGLALGLYGATLLPWGVWPSRPAALGRVRAMTHGATLAFAALSFWCLGQVQVVIEPPQQVESDRLGSADAWTNTTASSWASADQICQRRGARLCLLQEWRLSPAVRDVQTPWEWVSIPSGGVRVSGLARILLAGNDHVPVAILESLAGDLVEGESPPRVRCCR